MSVWSDIHKRSNGKQLRKEEQADITDRIKKSISPEYWKSLYSAEPVIYVNGNNDLMNELNEFSWDKNKRASVGDYYVIDHLDLI